MNPTPRKPASAARLFTGLLLGASILSTGTGCGLIRTLHAPNPQVAPLEPVAREANPMPPEFVSTDGSLWPTQGGFSPFVDNKAIRRGDIVLVEVLSKNTGKKDATTDTSREASISGSIRRLFGFEEQIQKWTSPDGEAGDPEMINVDSKNQFKGAGTTQRSDDLKATVSAVVTNVLANGNLVIYGHQIVQVNSEASVLTVQGIVRPSDIGQDNRVLSNRIANAQIEFDGSGVVTDKQHPGLGMRAFDWLWPF